MASISQGLQSFALSQFILRSASIFVLYLIRTVAAATFCLKRLYDVESILAGTTEHRA